MDQRGNTDNSLLALGSCLNLNLDYADFFDYTDLMFGVLMNEDYLLRMTIERAHSIR
jgi:hypothetical protein